MDERLQEGIKKTRDFYSMKKGAKIIQREFGYFCMDRWIAEGHLKKEDDLSALFGFDENGISMAGNLGWCEAAFNPIFKEEVLEDTGEYELVRDFAGRHVLFFKGRRSGFMPTYEDHPVKDWETWERDVKWRLDPKTEDRYKDEAHMQTLRDNEKLGMWTRQGLVGGFMYLRSLAGPEGILYMVYDDPELVHDMMKAWFDLADAVIAHHQKHVSFEEVFLAEDICYNGGPLISPNMIREFLFPYYQQLINNMRTRQLDKSINMIVQIDTDGDCRPVIPLYQEIGMTYMSPFEVASGCDVVELRKQYPELLMSGGIDKRILAKSKDAIDREVDRIMPFMADRGGYIPTCDHGVPEEVPFENYMHYRKRMLEF